MTGISMPKATRVHAAQRHKLAPAEMRSGAAFARFFDRQPV